MAQKFKPCSVELCNGNAHDSAMGCKGYCKAHYSRLRRYGDPLGRGTLRKDNSKTLRFMRDIALPCKSTECLVWPFNTNKQGYGALKVDGKTISAHRYICQAINGAPPTPHHEAAHSCGKGHLGCVNPNHLSWKTKAENAADKIDHDTHMRGERHFNCKLTEEQARYILSMKGVKSLRKLAAEFGVTFPNISSIHKRRSWAWLE